MITICFIIFAVVLCYLIYNFNIDAQDQKQFDDMAQTITIEENTDENADNDNGLADLINQNSDCIGWVRISGTKIDYPVMQTKDNPQYYLRRDFNKQYSYLGTPFMDSRCDLDMNDAEIDLFGFDFSDMEQDNRFSVFCMKDYEDAVFFTTATNNVHPNRENNLTTAFTQSSVNISTPSPLIIVKNSVIPS